MKRDQEVARKRKLADIQRLLEMAFEDNDKAQIERLERLEKQYLVVGKQLKREKHATYCSQCDVLEEVAGRIDGEPVCHACFV